MKIIKKTKWLWINFWGKKYRIIKNGKAVKEILIYRHKIYVLKDKENK